MDSLTVSKKPIENDATINNVILLRATSCSLGKILLDAEQLLAQHRPSKNTTL
ncbi:hypothetical protein [Photobacterium indicum]|uniref:hypothetical protein n=1 Tax=Photobacterium indicum TaxID=81447 RepID=UPI003D0AB267